MKPETKKNVYLEMPLQRVQADAQIGVSAARRALSIRDPQQARAMGIGITPSEQKKMRS